MAGCGPVGGPGPGGGAAGVKQQVDTAFAAAEAKLKMEAAQDTEAKAEQSRQQEAQKVLDQNSIEVNKGLEQLASCLIGHQDAALAIPEAIRANLPKAGRVLTFTRSLQVNTGTGLRIQIEAERPVQKAGLLHVGLAVGAFLGLGILGGVASRKIA